MGKVYLTVLLSEDFRGSDESGLETSEGPAGPGSQREPEAAHSRPQARQARPRLRGKVSTSQPSADKH